VEGPRRRARQPEVDLGEAAGAGRHQRHPDDPVAEELGVVGGQGHDRHAAHRVADEHEGAGGGDCLDHAGQVVAEVVDVVAGRRTLAAAVAALVPEHEAAEAAQVAALVVPRVQVQGVAVAEDQGEPVVALAARQRVVDLDVQQRPVVGGDLDHAAAQRAERLVALGVAAQRPPDGGLLREQPQGRAGGEGTRERRAHDPPVEACHHRTSVAALPASEVAPTCSRGTRGPTLVTISYPIVPHAAPHSSAEGSPSSPGPKSTAVSPSATGAPPMSSTNWSMHTVPATRWRRPPRSTWAALVACRGTPSP
jgi:hypothetical protein